MIAWTFLASALLTFIPYLPRYCAVGGSAALAGISMSVIPVYLSNSYESFCSLGTVDQLSFPLFFLSCLIQFALALSTLSYPLQRVLNMNFLLLTLLLFVVLTFSSSSLLAFYVFFEASLLPIFLLVLSWGYQPERLKAGLSLLFYTLVASLPLLLVVLSFQHTSFFMAASLFKTQNLCWLNSWFQVLLLLGVLVKIPIFGPHQWLPKAHVEAPVEGSMVLAAVLLKLGGYGFARLFPYTSFLGFFPLNCFSLTLAGSSIISLVCLFQFDMKILIAYSSVAHMSLVIAPLLLKSQWGATAALAVMIAHGASSSLLFAASNLLTKTSGSRSLIMAKGLLTSNSIFPALWFLACSANMAGPFTFNLMAELESIVALAKHSLSTALPFGLMMFMAAAYSLSLYALAQHSATSSLNALHPVISKVDLLTLTFHLFFIFSLTLAGPFFSYT